jgi:hypothetical protein
MKSKKNIIGVGVRRLVRGAWWIAWTPLATMWVLYLLSHLPGWIIIFALNGDISASRWLHEETDWATDGLWKFCPANDPAHSTQSL